MMLNCWNAKVSTIRVQKKVNCVVVNDVMFQILWTRYFLDSQGYKVHDSVLYQDNQSLMLLEKMAEALATKGHAMTTFCISS